MKKLLFFSTIYFSVPVIAQNVGIGTNLPAAKMQINSTASFGRPTLKLFDSSTTSAATIEFQNASGTNYWQMGGILHNTIPAQSFFHYYTNSSPMLFSIRGDGNVGIGAPDPNEKLVLASGNLKLSNSDKGIILNSANRPFITRGFDPFTSGNYSGLGRWGLFMEPNRITIGFPGSGGSGFKISGYGLNSTISKNVVDVTIDGSNGVVNIDGNLGVGMTTLPTEKLDVSGNINLRGNLKIDGSAGTYGQVYTTGGPSFNPEWRTLAFANSTRFSASLSGGGNSTALNYSPDYNTNTTDITIGANSITVNKTGLYHLDGFLSFTAVYTGTYTQASAPQVSIAFVTGSDLYYGCYSQDMTERVYYTGPFNKVFFHQAKFTYDIYITAGQTLALSRIFSGQPVPATFTNVGRIAGYLIY